MKDIQKKLDTIFRNAVGSRSIKSATLRIQGFQDELDWSAAYGSMGPDGPDIQPDSPYFIASATKIFTATAIMMLHEEGLLNLEDTLLDALPHIDLTGLHLRKGKDHTPEIRIFHLLAHTSGLPDYFEQAGTGRRSLLKELLEKGDKGWDLNDVLERSRKMKPPFVPAISEGSGFKAHYSDTNYQLLGAIIERCTGQSLGQALGRLIFDPLNLRHTYMYGQDHAEGKERRTEPSLFCYGQRWLEMPRAMASFAADGGMVSTSAEQIVFLKALLHRKLIRSGDLIQRMQQWNPLFFPFRYGFGLMRFQLPRIFTLFRTMPAFIGHSGASGAINFYCPERDIYVAGTMNQLANKSLPFQWMSRILSI
ncbi:MAG: beta-lactamase family protein [Leptospiraceae bacterium]|nr:beta-lactamase family protein [Leptospiraceae bacterium]MCB1171617.1 beta-lactamase family protein [Leptospiraceae bacterium]